MGRSLIFGEILHVVARLQDRGLAVVGGLYYEIGIAGPGGKRYYGRRNCRGAIQTAWREHNNYFYSNHDTLGWEGALNVSEKI